MLNLAKSLSIFDIFYSDWCLNIQLKGKMGPLWALSE